MERGFRRIGSGNHRARGGLPWLSSGIRHLLCRQTIRALGRATMPYGANGPGFRYDVLWTVRLLDRRVVPYDRVDRDRRNSSNPNANPPRQSRCELFAEGEGLG